MAVSRRRIASTVHSGCRNRDLKVTPRNGGDCMHECHHCLYDCACGSSSLVVPKLADGHGRGTSTRRTRIRRLMVRAIIRGDHRGSMSSAL